MALGRIGWIQIDCSDPIALARFWSEVLDQPLGEVLGDPPQYSELVGPEGHPRVGFQRVPEGKSGKNRLHLDVLTDDLEGVADRIETLGGRRTEEQARTDHDYVYRIMLDPEGNEFCLIRG